MQEPLENLSPEANGVYEYLADGDRTETVEQIADATGLTPGQVAEALRELEAAKRAVQSFGGWSAVG